ncbi:MAG: hypothetical protein K2M31_07860 [Muribaculaceae bacterium]|nr:hypothetical protein [Muribaculaceae bacterium]
MDRQFLNGQFDAGNFFERLAEKNLLARTHNFVFCRVSDLTGFEEAVNNMQEAQNFICVADVDEGFMSMNNTPKTRSVKTVFFAMRHAEGNMSERKECMEIMREIFRQFMSVLNLTRVKLQHKCIYLDPQIDFHEIPEYFFSGCAAAYYQIAVDVFTDIVYRNEEWSESLDSLFD